MKIYRFGRVSCLQNAAKPRENVIFGAQTTYFTFFNQKLSFFEAPKAPKHCILRIRGLENYRFLAFWAHGPGAAQGGGQNRSVGL